MESSLQESIEDTFISPNTSSNDFSSDYCISIKNCTNFDFWISVKSGGRFKAVINDEKSIEWIRTAEGTVLKMKLFSPGEEQGIKCPFGQPITIRVAKEKSSLLLEKEGSLLADIFGVDLLQDITMFCLCLYDQTLSIVYV